LDNPAYVRIHEPEIENVNSVRYKISFSKNLRKFFHSNEFYVKYDTSIETVSDDILVIPCLGSLITTAWAGKASVYIDTVDAEYLYSLRTIREAYNKIYPGLDFKGAIIPNKVVKNKPRKKGWGMLFSGGLDSTTLFIQDRKEKPNLFTVIGGVIPSDNYYFTKKIETIYTDFAKKEGVNLNFVESDVRFFLNELLLSVTHKSQLYSLPWWETINHGLVQLSLCAPLTINRISSMKIALIATAISNFGTDSRIVGNIRWAGINVIPSGYEYNRQEKKHYILKNFIKNNYHPKLQVCLYSPSIDSNLNCGYCEKCSRSIIGLMVEGIDPRKCGFPVYDDFFEHARTRVIPTSTPRNWTMIQECMAKNKYTNLNPRISDFFKWFQNYDFSEQIEESYIESLLSSLLSHILGRSPGKIQKIVMKYLNKIRKKRHWLR
jgi:hypothetical protein